MSKTSQWKQLVFAASILIALTVIDLVFLGRSFSQKGTPQLSLIFSLRSLGILIASGLLISYVLRASSPSAQLQAAPAQPPWLSALALVMICIAGYFIGLFHYSPILFGWFAREDSIIEASEFWMLAMGATFMAFALYRTVRQRKPLSVRLAVILPMLGFLIVALEEISWGQRLFGFETTGHFGSNLQGETNLHNFVTNQSEIIFYFGSFVWFVLVAFVADRTTWLSSFHWLKAILPSRALILLFAPGVAFNYGEWDQIPTQVAVFVTLIILGYYSLMAIRSSGITFERVVMVLSFMAFIAVQALLIAQGHLMLRLWQNTEYKELLLILPALIWAIEVYVRSAKPESNLSQAP